MALVNVRPGSTSPSTATLATGPGVVRGGSIIRVNTRQFLLGNTIRTVTRESCG